MSKYVGKTFRHVAICPYHYMFFLSPTYVNHGDVFIYGMSYRLFQSWL